MKSKLEIIQETAKHFNSGNRAEANRDGTDSAGCYYLTEDGYSCAVGRFMTEDALKTYRYPTTASVNQLVEQNGGGVNSTTLPMDRQIEILDTLLQEEVRGHEPKFWQNLQSLHDLNYYWNAEGLSELGEEKVNELIATWVTNYEEPIW